MGFDLTASGWLTTGRGRFPARHKTMGKTLRVRLNGAENTGAAGKMAALDKLEGFACRPRCGILGYR